MVDVTGLSSSDSLISSTTDTYEGGGDLTPSEVATASRSVFDEFNDGFLSSAEASDGTTLTVGPTYNPSDRNTAVAKDGDFALLVTSPGGGVYYSDFTIDNSKFPIWTKIYHINCGILQTIFKVLFVMSKKITIVR